MRKDLFKFSKHDIKYLGILYCLALIINLVIEILNKDSLGATFQSLIHNPLIFLYNALIILVTLSISLLVKRRMFTCSLISVLWIICGITNNILLNFRTTPFTAVDLTLISDALVIIDKYITPLNILLIIVSAVVLIVSLTFAFIKLPKFVGTIHYITNSIIIVVALVLTLVFTNIGMKTNFLARNFGNIANAYIDYGFAYCFMNSLVNTGISKPSNYSEETINTIVDSTTEMIDQDESQISEEESKTPNIIFLQLESFFDPTYVSNFSFSNDPIPTFRWLKENYTSGFLSVPSVGAGTANTEFEIISGMDLDFFGPGEYPYKTILKETTCESMAYNLKELGYSTHAIHNNSATFYGRNVVFPNLGFDTFTSLEYMSDVTYNPLGWANDSVLVNEIMKSLTSTSSKDYIYTISVQGHGKYPKDAASLYDGETSDGEDGDFLDTIIHKIEGVTRDNFTTSEELSSGDTDNSSNTDLLSVSTSNNTDASDESTTNRATVSTFNFDITMDGIENDRKFAFEYYVNQIHEMDSFLGKLIAKLEAYDEDVILVMYGDHLPSLNIEEEDLSNENIYQTEYVIWSSKGVFDKQQDRDLEAYQLSAYVQQLLHHSTGLLTKLHQKELSGLYLIQESTTIGLGDNPNQSQKVNTTPDPTNGITNNDSTAIAFASEDTPISYLEELNLLQYDMLYGKHECYSGINPYSPTNMHLGTYDITIQNTNYVNSVLTITGNYFTPFSKIKINGTVYVTNFISSDTLTCKVDEIEDNSTITVAQIDDDGIELSETDTYYIAFPSQ